MTKKEIMYYAVIHNTDGLESHWLFKPHEKPMMYEYIRFMNCLYGKPVKLTVTEVNLSNGKITHRQVKEDGE